MFFPKMADFCPDDHGAGRLVYRLQPGDVWSAFSIGRGHRRGLMICLMIWLWQRIATHAERIDAAIARLGRRFQG
ncbi:hypothetical protein HGG75_24190 [Ochrobactrum pseudogrignonense]|nr:hypothetical protein [Brucella pseudogrignonensis]